MSREEELDIEIGNITSKMKDLEAEEKKMSSLSIVCCNSLDKMVEYKGYVSNVQGKLSIYREWLKECKTSRDMERNK